MSQFVEKFVHLRRKEPRTHVLYPTEVLAAARKKLGAVFVGRSPLRGLDPIEEKKYLPRLAGFDPDSRTWEKDTRSFWNEYFIEVPVDGVVLNLSTNDGEPVSLEDYVRYKWCLRHPQVAESEAKARSSKKTLFYIFDPEEDVQRRHGETVSRRRAYVEYTKIATSTDMNKARWIFRMLTDLNPDRLSEAQIDNQLEELARTRPEEFYKVATDKDLAVRAGIQEMISLGLLKRIGNHVFFGDNKLGETMEEAVEFLKSPRNNETSVILKARLDEKRRAIHEGVAA